MRLLFITSTRIGDAVLSTGLLDHLLTREPGTRATVAAGPAAAGLFAQAPGVEAVIPMPKRRRGGHWWRLWRAVAGRPWDLVVDLRGSAIAWTLLARRRLVHGRAPADRHRVEALGALVGREDDPPSPRLWSGAEARAAAATLVPEGPPVLALGPTANWAGKVWPAERFGALVEQLTGPGTPLAGARVAVVGGPGETAMAAPVLEAVPAARRIDLVDRADLPTLYACLERCRLYVGNDSGLMHVAAASGVPTLGLFGPTRPAFYRPWGAHCAWTRTDRTPDELMGPDFDHRNPGRLMDGLPVARAAGAAADLLRRTAEAA